MQIQGAFFGDNAQELSGVFKDTQTDTKGYLVQKDRQNKTPKCYLGF